MEFKKSEVAKVDYATPQVSQWSEVVEVECRVRVQAD